MLSSASHLFKNPTVRLREIPPCPLRPSPSSALFPSRPTPSFHAPMFRLPLMLPPSSSPFLSAPPPLFPPHFHSLSPPLPSYSLLQSTSPPHLSDTPSPPPITGPQSAASSESKRAQMLRTSVASARPPPSHPSLDRPPSASSSAFWHPSHTPSDHDRTSQDRAAVSQPPPSGRSASSRAAGRRGGVEGEGSHEGGASLHLSGSAAVRDALIFEVLGRGGAAADEEEETILSRARCMQYMYIKIYICV